MTPPRSASHRKLSFAGIEPPAVGAPREVVDGDPTLIRADHVELAVVRRPAPGESPADACLTGAWPGQASPLVLAYAVLR